MHFYILRARYLLLPVVFLCGLFLLDKIFLLPEVRDNFIQPGGAMYYRQRAEQLEIVRAELPKLHAQKFKTAVVFGDSRSFSIGNLTAAAGEMLLGFPTADWRLYNFAAPQAVPAYHAYLAEKIFARLPQERPGAVLLGISPDAFNRNSFLFADPVLKFGVDPAWVQRNRTHIPAADYTAFENSRRYALVGMGFSLKDLYLRTLGEFQEPVPVSFTERLAMMGMIAGMSKGNHMPDSIREVFQNARQYIGAMAEAQKHDYSLYSYEAAPQRKLLNLTHGAQYLWAGAAGTRELQAETERLVGLYFQNFVVSEEQFYFFRETVRQARLGGARVVVFWPKVNPFMREAYAAEPRIQAIWRRVQDITRAEGGQSLDLNEPGRVNCDSFYDASHMSVTCFPLLTGMLLQELDQ